MVKLILLNVSSDPCSTKEISKGVPGCSLVESKWNCPTTELLYNSVLTVNILAAEELTLGTLINKLLTLLLVIINLAIILLSIL